MNGGDVDTAACHAIAGNRTINSAGQQEQCLSAASHRQTAGTFQVCAVDKSVGIPNFHHNGGIRIVHIHRQMGIRLQQDTAQLRTDLRRFQRERLIGTLCLHFKGIRTGQHLVQIRHCLGGDVPHGLFADAGTAEGCGARVSLNPPNFFRRRRRFFMRMSSNVPRFRPFSAISPYFAKINSFAIDNSLMYQTLMGILQSLYQCCNVIFRIFCAKANAQGAVHLCRLCAERLQNAAAGALGARRTAGNVDLPLFQIVQDDL